MDPAVLQNDYGNRSDLNVNEFDEYHNSSSQNSITNNEEYEDPVDQDEFNETYQKSTFKNSWHAKKRLQVFSLLKQVPVSLSPMKTTLKTVLVKEKIYNEKGEVKESLVPMKKPPRRSTESPADKVKSSIEEIEWLKKIEVLQATPVTIEEKLLSLSQPRRSRSKSSEREFTFRKREKKDRNYRRSDTSRRSPSPVITKAKNKVEDKRSKCKYPKNWEEFSRDKWTFEKLLSKNSNSYSRGNNVPNDVSKQLLFENPAEPIKPYYYKDDKGEQILVPFRFLRHTKARPRLTYNVNLRNIKENHLTRTQLLSMTHNKHKSVLEKFFGRTTRTKFRSAEPIGQRNWYQKNWKDSESRVLETSIGLSFLQTYSDDDDEEEEELNICIPVITKPVEVLLGKKEDEINSKLENKKVNLHLEIDEFVNKTEPEEEKIPRIIKEERKSTESKRDDSKKSHKTDKKLTDSPSTPEDEKIRRNRTKSESIQEETFGIEEEASWTPERIIQPCGEDMWNETPKRKNEETIQEDRKDKKKVDTNFENIEERQRAREIHSEDEWDETPRRKKEKSLSEEIDVKTLKKDRKKSDSEKSVTEKKKIKKKKKKLDRKKKQKEKEKKARKKREKLKAEKLKLKRKRQKEKERDTEKEILKKLKQEIQLNLEEVEREEREAKKIQEENEAKRVQEERESKKAKETEEIFRLPVNEVKIEKPVEHEKMPRPAEDLRNFLDKKVGKTKDLREKVDRAKLKNRENEEIVIENLNISPNEKGKNKKSPSKCVKKEICIPHIELEEKPVRKDKLLKDVHHLELEEKVVQMIDSLERNFETETRETFPLEKDIVDETSKVSVLPEKTENSLHQKVDDIPEMPVKEVTPKLKTKTKEELICETTPDTDEYHSNWESDEGVSPVVKLTLKKAERSWESDEEIFDRPYTKESPGIVPFGGSPVLEMPLHIKSFSRRQKRESRSSGTKSRTRSPEYLDADSEIKLLEAERINLSKERMQLEMEKIRIHELERKKTMEEIEYISEEVVSPSWQSDSFIKKQDRRRSRWDLREDHVDSSTSKDRKRDSEEKHMRHFEKDFIISKSSEIPNKAEKSYSSNSVFSISSSPEITSTKSPTPTVLESAYEEFMKQVSVTDDTNELLVISSTESDLPYSGKQRSPSKVGNQKQTRRTRSERDKTHERNVKMSEMKKEKDQLKVIGTTDPKLLQEILLPGEVPIEEIPMPMPMPVPSPKIVQNIPAAVVLNVTSDLLPQESTTEYLEKSEVSQKKHAVDSPSRKPFAFSTLVLPTKKPVLLQKSNWKLDENSDEDLPPAKKTLEDIKLDHENTKPYIIPEVEDIPLSIEDAVKKAEETNRRIEEILGENKGEIKDRKEEIREKKDEMKERREDEHRSKDVKEREKRRDDRSSKRKHSRSRSPVTNTSKDKRRREEDSRRREEDTKRREEDFKRREDDNKRREEDSKRREEDFKKREEDSKRREEDIRRREEETKKRDAEGRRRIEDSRRREEEANRRERGKRPPSPQRYREPSPRRRRLLSPHRRSPPRHRSPPRKQPSSRRPDRGDRRTPPRSSPSRRRRSHSPPKQGPAPRRRSSSSRERSPRHYHYSRRSKSPGHSPMDGLKRSVADSTISDDLLPQPYLGESSNSPLNSSTATSTGKRARLTMSPKRPSLDERINQVLGIEAPLPSQWKPEVKQEFAQQHNVVYSGYPQHENLPRMSPSVSSLPTTTSKVLQVGNILQVVPTEELCLPPMTAQAPPVHKIVQPYVQNIVQPPTSVQKIVQVGNMLQIVPTEMEAILPSIPPPPPPVESPTTKPEIAIVPPLPPPPEKPSAEAILAAKNAERKAERLKKRQEKEERKQEKERKRKDKDKRRKIRLKISTEEMIKRALEMDGLIENEHERVLSPPPEIISDTPGLDPSKSILSTSTSRCSEDFVKAEGRKSVQFADGVRPGEGTSPSGGEELSSPPPQAEDMPKPKKYRKMDASKKKKRKIKVKVIKKRLPSPDSDEEYENLPPPSPPPGSPPPHIFPLRVKVHTINNIPQHYLPAYGVTTTPQQPIMNQPHAVMNVGVGYQTPPPTVYRPPPPPPPVNVIGQHYARAGHVQAMGGHMHGTQQHMHQHGAPPISHRDHQPYGSF